MTGSGSTLPYKVESTTTTPAPSLHIFILEGILEQLIY